ncbi:MAG TPA: GNAT family N-acetyltransferase [Pseudolysinimonas sp.]|nr:GNAT family N-acetyltransferase [Pseudolysinimonas sp.]
MINDDRAIRARLLAAYDEQLRTDAEIPGAATRARLGPLRVGTFAGGRGFVTYSRPSAGVGRELAGLVPEALAYFTAQPDIREVEWKTRGHDDAPGLYEALTSNGFMPEEPESIMIGEARLLAVDVPLPDGVTLRRITEESDVRAMSAMQDEVFGDSVSVEMADELVARVARGDELELWVAEADREIVTAGRLEPVPDSEFAGIWGGATRPRWRGRGIYRALTAARARSALARGRTLINSDSTEFSRPILERSGLIAVSTTTPYLWRPNPSA